MYILLLVFSLADDQISSFEELKEALEEFGCYHYPLKGDQYMIMARDIAPLSRMVGIMPERQGIIVKVEHFIL